MVSWAALALQSGRSNAFKKRPFRSHLDGLFVIWHRITLTMLKPIFRYRFLVKMNFISNNSIC